MKRRTLLQAVVLGGTGLLSGCIDQDGGQGATPTPVEDGTPTGGSPTDEPTKTDEDDTPTKTDDGSSGNNGMTDRSFEVLSSDCGSGENSAAVKRGADRVEVEGTIRGRNGCYTAELDRAEYDDGSDELTVEVRSYEDSDGASCMQCIVDIDYRATFDFEEGTPDEVQVRHNGEGVTTD